MALGGKASLLVVGGGERAEKATLERGNAVSGSPRQSSALISLLATEATTG